MKMNTMVGLITGSVIGATMGVLSVSQMSPREQRRIMKGSKKMISTAGNIMNKMNMF